jgi:dTDP-glucose pyrophosphorylase
VKILIPMAGNGQRFVDAGYAEPKPFIDVLGKPMIERVVENLGGPRAGQYIFVVRDYKAMHRVRAIVPDCEVVIAREQTAGAACTALLAQMFIDNNDPLLIANSDQIVESVTGSLFYEPGPFSPDGIIYTFASTHPKWSYAVVDERSWVWGIAEKQVVSRRATCGIYWFRRGGDFCRAARDMIAKNLRVNNEFYIAPVFNQMIAAGADVRERPVKKMWGLGTPEDLNAYVQAQQ